MEKTTFQGATNEAKAEGGLAEISDHHFCVTGTEAIVMWMSSIMKNEPLAIVKFALEQLQKDGYISRHPVGGGSDWRNHHIHITNSGRLFKEAGGYARRRFWETAGNVWTATKTIAAVVNAIAIGWLSWRATQSAEGDKLQDDQIIQLERTKVTLEERITALEIENSTLRLAQDTTRD
ncbi:MAG: hypothetical protein IPG10_16940 [Flavobacteriales bacterium]|nr:hypothetical protein [Flavobacteriales bacterium]MBK6755371.1 hypothetical protein [Flavobacteriales bacterium]